MRRSQSPGHALVLLAAAAASLFVDRGGGGLRAQADVVISEILAVNQSSGRDEDGDFSDWIELYNAGDRAADLEGHYLTDSVLELTKWRFPSTVLEPNRFLVVFASDKDRRRAGAELHTNFKLSGGGEYLALVAPDGETVLQEFAPFPAQVGDFSYGLAQNAGFAHLVDSGASARALVPVNGAAGTAWMQPGFDDAGWTSGVTGVGYDRNPNYRPFIGLDVRGDMEGTNTTAYVRIPFTVLDPSEFSGFELRVRYDDGFAAFVNGTRVASANAPESLSWNSSSTGQHDDNAAVVFETFSFGASAGLLRAGENILAIHGLNANLGSSDFLVSPELDAFGAGELQRDLLQFFPEPTPGWGNVPGYPGVSARPMFHPPGGVFQGSQDVVITTASADAAIHYTLDGSDPGVGSPLYDGPIRLSQSAIVRAASFEADSAPSPIVSAGFLGLAADMAVFDSDIPVVLVENFSGGGVPSGSFQPAYLAIYEPVGAQTFLTGAPDLETRIGIKIRGSSTQGRPKKAYSFEAWDEQNEDKDITPLGLPTESDWILYGAYNFDRALMRNTFIYDLSRRVGRYAARSRFCEVFLNTGGGSLSYGDYQGVYSFMEKIKRGPDRVDVERLTASIDAEPDISGGYMFKIDRLDPGDSGFSAGGRRMGWVYPKEDYVTGAQSSWLRADVDSFYTALQGPQFRDPAVGYARYIDVDSWVDHHILNVLAKNVDALRLSTYYFKRRGRPLEAGPIWDFDRSMDSSDGRDDDPRTWNGTGDGTRYFDYPWWDRLFQDVDFWQRWRDRWAELRRGPLSISSMHSMIDAMRVEITQAEARDAAKWHQTTPSGWQGEVNRLKGWLQQRVLWIDSQFPAPPMLSRGGGRIDPGFELSISTRAGEIWWRADGQDPRERGGAIAAEASSYEGPIRIDDNARVVARARISDSSWSAPVAATYVVVMPPMAITELMYHPPPAPLGSPYRTEDFEFIELLNTADAPLDATGASLTGAVEFTFAAGSTLDPGEYVVVVRNRDAFASRYGLDGIRIAGEYTGRLENSGETVGLEGPLREPILLFAYSDLWLPTTDGGGDSLVFTDPWAAAPAWAEAENWMASSVIGGTPGRADPGLSLTGGRQRPGDANQDGALDLSDAVALLLRLFTGEGGPLPCEGASIDAGGNGVLLDVNSDGAVDISDPIHLLGFLFSGGSPPASGTRCVRIEGCPDACAL